MDEWWNLMHYMLLIKLKRMVNKYIADEEMYRVKLTAYKRCLYKICLSHVYLQSKATSLGLIDEKNKT